MKRKLFPLLLCLSLLGTLLALPAFASEPNANEPKDVHLFSPDQETVTDAVCGDLLAFCMDLKVQAPVDGNIRSAAMDMKLSGTVSRNVTVLAASVETEETFRANDVIIAASTVIFRGECRNLTVRADSVMIYGSVTGEMEIQADEVIIVEGAVFENAKISSPTEPVVQKSEGKTDFAKLKDTSYNGQVTFTKLRSDLVNTLINLPFAALAVVLMALLAWALFGRVADRVSVKMNERPGGFLLRGLLWMFVLPVCSVLLIAGVVTLPVGLAALLIYILLLLLSPAIAAVLLSRKWMIGKSAVTSVIVFSLILGVLTNLPIVGTFISFACTLITFGGFATLLSRKKNPPDPAESMDTNMDFRV